MLSVESLEESINNQHLNIRSHHRNLDSLITLLKNVELKFSFIGINANNFATFTNRLAK